MYNDKRIDFYEITLQKIGLNNALIRIVLKPLFAFLKIKKLETLLTETKGLRNEEFIDCVYSRLNFKNKTIFHSEKVVVSNAPFVFIANHPTGLLDGISIIRAMQKKGRKVKVVVNEVLKSIDPIHQALGENLIYVNLFAGENNYLGIREIMKSVSNNEIVVIFPAGDISRLGGIKGNISDYNWSDTSIKLIRRLNVEVIPVFVNLKNSFGFYLINTLSSKLGLLFVVREFFNKKNKTVEVIFGNTINKEIVLKDKKFLRKSVYQLIKK